MVMLAEHYDYVIGGDPDRDTVDLAVVHATTDGGRGHVTKRADRRGYDRLLAWVRQQPLGGQLPVAAPHRCRSDVTMRTLQQP